MNQKNKEVFVMCVMQDDHHIEESILTDCVMCGCKIWCSITNCDKNAICIPCAISQKDAKFAISPESLDEAVREIKKMENDR